MSVKGENSLNLLFFFIFRLKIYTILEMKQEDINYGEFIKKRRKEQSITQNTLAEALHCTPQAISKYENGKSSIYLGMLGDICRVLNVDLESFLSIRSEKNNDYCEKHTFSEKKFSDYLCFLREKSDLTQKAVSNDLGISQQKLSKWETGSSFPDINELKILADYYKLSVSELYFALPKEENIPEMNEEISKEEKKKEKKQTKIWLLIFVILAVAGLIVTLNLILHFNSHTSSTSSEPIEESNDGSTNTPPRIDSFYIDT